MFYSWKIAYNLQPTRDPTGAAIAVFTARTHSPQISTHQTTLQVIQLLINVFLHSVLDRN